MNQENNIANGGLLISQQIVRVCLILFAAIAIFGGTLQMYLGEPDTNPRLDNIHRFMAGVYLACGFITLFAAITIKKQNTLIFLIAFGGLLGATGRLISMSKVGLPEPNALWLGYMLSEIVLPIIIIAGQWATNRKLNN